MNSNGNECVLCRKKSEHVIGPAICIFLALLVVLSLYCPEKFTKACCPRTEDRPSAYQCNNGTRDLEPEGGAAARARPDHRLKLDWDTRLQNAKNMLEHNTVKLLTLFLTFQVISRTRRRLFG